MSARRSQLERAAGGRAAEGGAQLVHCVARGTSMVVTAPATVRTVVGAGTVVVIFDAAGRGGGVLHLPVSVDSTVGELTAAVGERVDQFMDELRAELEIGAGSVAEVIGGADVMEILPTAERDEVARDRAGVVAAVLESRGFATRRIEAGGTASRRLFADFGARTVRVVVDGGGRPAAAAAAARGTVIELRPPADVIPVDMGQLVVAEYPIRLTALLGSCVGVALWDPARRLGGLAHTMMPIHPQDPPTRDLARYADTAPAAVRAAMVERGAAAHRLRAKLVGGAAVIYCAGGGALGDLGARNAAVARRALAALDIPVVAEDLGGREGRRIAVNLEDFSIEVVTLGTVSGAIP